jgi:DNA-binding MarR family transcriptional regulator
MHDEEPPDGIANRIRQWQEAMPDIGFGDALPVAARIKVLGKLFDARCERRTEEWGLHQSGAETLYLLLLQGEPYAMSPTGLAQGLHVTTASMTNRLDQLEKRGYIERRPDARDRRALLIYLTESGRQNALCAVAATVEEADTFLAPLNKNEQETLDKLLQQLLRGHTP